MTRQTAHHQATHCTCHAIMTVIHGDKTRTISNDMIVQTLAKLTTPIKQTTPRRCVA